MVYPYHGDHKLWSCFGMKPSMVVVTHTKFSEWWPMAGIYASKVQLETSQSLFSQPLATPSSFLPFPPFLWPKKPDDTEVALKNSAEVQGPPHPTSSSPSFLWFSRNPSTQAMLPWLFVASSLAFLVPMLPILRRSRSCGCYHRLEGWGGTGYGWLVVTGTMEFYDFPFSWEFHHPNWLSLICFRGVGIPPTSVYIYNGIWMEYIRWNI